ncbi:MAG TPA: maleylpyruvate isomerase family mycothiol-dependent enzyme [Acidimicrobiales bacterium]|nr:maleylpyruvate isomerase family mycothiol-dependent enzyme [Acidimicrobiales bacterium]
MSLSLERSLAVIDDAADELAALAAGRFDEPVAGAPGWTVRDLLRHLVEVYWFWNTIVAEGLTSPPDEGRRPEPPADDHLISAVLVGERALTAALRAADQGARVYTWAPAQQDVAFVTRHQVQETLVHGYDVAAAVGMPWAMAPDASADAVEEFLTFSVSTPSDPAETPRDALDGVIGLRCTDRPDAWTVEDDVVEGTIKFERGLRDDAVVLSGTAGDILLWLYGRIHLEGEADHTALVGRLRALSFTS